MNIFDIIEQGENNHVDFKQELNRDIGKTIASFATCGGGMILVGVTDSNGVIGIEVNDTENAFRSKIDNARASIHPSCFAECDFYTIEDKKIVVITVGNGPRPIYYYDFRPYLRDGTVSRPATPDEVEELVLNFYFTQGLRAVKNELKIIKGIIEKQLPIFELPIDSWKDLIKRTGTDEQEKVLEKVSTAYDRVLLWNNYGTRIAMQQTIQSDDLLEGHISIFVERRKEDLISTDRLSAVITSIEEELRKYGKV